jgi:hypothetical protein
VDLQPEKIKAATAAENEQITHLGPGRNGKQGRKWKSHLNIVYLATRPH